MCGFLAEFCLDKKDILPEDKFKELLFLSKHRGPDSTETVRFENAQLGFNRLAILDLSANGNQPKQSPSGRFHVVFNGEIYNFKNLALRYKLTNLSSSSDTEVLVHLLDILGVEKTIKELNGMFAIAIYETGEDFFYLTRDFAGIKPMFYGITEKGIVTASQFDQIYKHPWFKVKLELRPEIMKEYFAFGYMQAPNTIYKNIFQVNPGELLKYDIKGVAKRYSIHHFDKAYNFSKAQEVDSVEQVLKSAVARQLVSDVPVATFLSGGIDSPLVSAYAKNTKSDIEAFTLEVKDPALNESEIAKAYAAHLALKQQVIQIEDNDLLQSIEQHFKAYPEPFGDYSSIPTYVITREAKKNHTVMLSGDGGDELFFGYPRMLDVLNKRWWFSLPLIARKSLCKITNQLGVTNTYAPYLKDLNALVINKHTKLPDQLLSDAFKNVTFSKELLKLYTLKSTSRTSYLHQLRWNEFYAHLQRILIKVDRASMAHSLEVRVPILDKEVIQAAWPINQDLRNKNDLKKELKNMLGKQVPQNLINKKKMGFAVPMEKWLRKELKADVLKHVFDKSFYGGEVFDSENLKIYVMDFFDNKHDNAWGVWHIYAWQKWAYLHLNNFD